MLNYSIKIVELEDLPTHAYRRAKRPSELSVAGSYSFMRVNMNLDLYSTSAAHFSVITTYIICQIWRGTLKLAVFHGMGLIRAHIHIAHPSLSFSFSTHTHTHQYRNHLGFRTIRERQVSSQSLINSPLIIPLQHPNDLQHRLFDLNSF